MQVGVKVYTRSVRATRPRRNSRREPLYCSGEFMLGRLSAALEKLLHRASARAHFDRFACTRLS